MRQIVNVLFTYPDAPSATTLKEYSWLLSSISSFMDQQAFAFMEDSEERMILGGNFAKIEPDHRGEFDLELGAAVPEWLPNLDGALEYTLDVRDPRNDVRRLSVSNQMTRFVHRDERKQYQVFAPRSELAAFIAAGSLLVPPNAPVVPVRSMASMRFRIAGGSAQEALENGIGACIDSLIMALNFLVLAELTVGKPYLPPLTPTFDRSSFDCFYIVMRGKEPAQFANWRITTSMRRSVLIPPHNVCGGDVERFRAVLDGAQPIDDVARLMSTARSYIEGGLLEFSLLQLIIAAEIATTRFVHDMLLSNGVSRKRLKEVGDDMTFSMMLNIYVTALSPHDCKPDAALVAKINEGRKKRNKLMHEGGFDAAQSYLRELYDATVEYVAFLDEARERKRRETTGDA